MPSIRIEGPYEVYFTSHDRGEPPHVHVDRENMAAKIWLEPVSVAYNRAGRSMTSPLSSPSSARCRSTASRSSSGRFRSAISAIGNTPTRSSYRRTLHIIGTALVSGIDVEVNTLVTRYNIDVLDAIYERIERLGVVAWNVHLPVARPGVETLSTDEVSQVQTVIERLRGHGLADIRLTDPTVSTVFITSEGYVRNGEFVSGNSGDLRRSSLTQICRSH